MVLISLFSSLCLLHAFWHLACTSFAVTGQWPGYFQSLWIQAKFWQESFTMNACACFFMQLEFGHRPMQLNPKRWHVYWTFWRCSSDVHEQWNQNLQQDSSFVFTMFIVTLKSPFVQLGWVVTSHINTTATVYIVTQCVLKVSHCHIPRQSQQNNVLYVTAHPMCLIWSILLDYFLVSRVSVNEASQNFNKIFSVAEKTSVENKNWRLFLINRIISHESMYDRNVNFSFAKA